MKKYLSLVFVLALLLSACGAPGSSISSNPIQAWVDQPAPGTVLPIGVFTLKAHARHISGSGISRLEFLVNGVPVGSVDTDASLPLVYAETDWNAVTPGQYLVSARAYAGGSSSESFTVLVCVSADAKEAFVSPSGKCDPTLVQPDNAQPQPNVVTPGDVTPTQKADAVPPTPTQAQLIITPTLAPPTATLIPPTATRTPAPPTATLPPPDTSGPQFKNLYHSSPAYYGGCGGSFTMEAVVTDPSGVASVTFGYRYEGGSVGGYTVVSGAAVGNSTYRVIIDNNTGNQAYNVLGGANGYIRWYVEARDTLGNVSTVTDQVADILFCPG